MRPPRKVLLVGIPIVFCMALVILSSSLGISMLSLGATISMSGAVSFALYARRRARRLAPAGPPPESHRPSLRRPGPLVYREGARGHGAPWGLMLAEGDPFAIPALEAYAAAATAAGSLVVAAEVRETLDRWKERNPC